MADKKIALDLEVNIKKGDMTLGELNKQLQDLGTNIQEQKDILIEFEKELLDLDKIQASTSKTELARQAELKDKQDELKVVNVFSTAMETISIVLGKVVDRKSVV